MNIRTRILLLLFVLTSSLALSSTGLIGKWHCNKITYQDGRELEVNHPLFSTYLTYELEATSAFISNHYQEKAFKVPTAKMGPN